MANEMVFSPHFVRLYAAKRKKSPEHLMKKVDDGIAELRNSDSPDILGVRKKGELNDYYSFEISRGHRILCQVERKKDTVSVHLHRVCDHKNVYGKD
jgi:mRNA-degrading endonuclease RelE of RelBE toxin-antitoxin system